MGTWFSASPKSPTHLSEEKPFFIENFRRIGAALRADRPDLVLNSGDISLDGAAGDSDLAAARALHDALDLPIRYLPGNHDLGDSQDAPAHGEGAIDATSRDRYLRHFDADFWSFDVPGWRVLGINAQLLGSDLEAAEEQKTVIAEAAATLDDRALALFLHKPLFDRGRDETAVTGRFVNPVPRRRLLALLAETPPALVACGHVHQYRETRADGAFTSGARRRRSSFPTRASRAMASRKWAMSSIASARMEAPRAGSSRYPVCRP